jgi:uncharacterized protein (TIRG00374 family)
MRKKLRLLFTLAGVLALAIVVFDNRHQLSSFAHLIKDLRWYVIVLIVFVQIGSYYVNGLYYRSILKVFGYRIGVIRLFEGALATNFVNYVLPSLGLAGAGYLSQVLDPDVPRGESVMAQLMRYGLSAFAVLVMMPVGFILVLMSKEGAHPIVRVTFYSALGVIALAICVVFLIQHEITLRHVVHWIARKIERLHPKLQHDPLSHFIDEFYAAYHAMTRQKWLLIEPLAWSVVYILIEISTLYLAFVAFGKFVGVGMVIMAYLFANIASIFGGVFFSTGVFEVGMAGTLVALGMPFALAFSATIVYRILNLLIGLPPGLYFYRKYLPKTKQKRLARRLKKAAT